MAGRRIRDEADARACLAAVARSGTTVVDWVRSHGVDGRSLQAWRLILERRRLARPRDLPFVELVVGDKVARPAPRYTVRVGDMAVEVDDGFDEVTLRRLLAVMSAC